ncbi:MAG: hypothetical protein HZB26_23060 [Candidatus Hydrogenedentes bacterium]|nr:hypothetical protein [Candidatus Hydrogenedentota bacterium]
MTLSQSHKCVVIILSCIVAACASTPKDKQGAAAGKKSAAAATADAAAGTASRTDTQPRVTLQTGDNYVGDIIHELGQKVGGSLVLTNGAELRAVGPLNFHQANYMVVAKTLAEAANCAIQECGGYLFLYPADIPSYSALTNVSLTGKLDPAYGEARSAMTFGYGTRVYAAFSVLSHVLGITVVADNAVADMRCGELTLGEIPIEAALEAILKSARVVAFNVDSTPEYIFFSTQQNTAARDLLLNPDALNEHETNVLNKKVSVYLPEPQKDPAHFVASEGASKLAEILPALSKQLGVPVVAEEEIENLPVNPVVMNNVRMRTALDLLIRQWLQPDFGYQVLSDKILIRRRDKEKTPPAA